MAPRLLPLLVVTALAPLASYAQEDDSTYPVPPPAISLEGVVPEVAAPRFAPAFHAQIVAPQIYTIGQPTSQAQYLLELLNRARADAHAEGLRLAAHASGNISTDPIAGAMKYYSVNVATLKAQFDSLPSPQPPLAFNPTLLITSYVHSQDMYLHGLVPNTFPQTHNNSATPPSNSSLVSPLVPNGDFGSRLISGNYSIVNGSFIGHAGENIFAYGSTLDATHAGYEIDWGNFSQTFGNITYQSIGGMQNPPDHRYNDHDLAFDPTSNTTSLVIYREIGISVLTGPGTGNGTLVGPLITTYDFGTQSGDTPFITGVVFKDLNGDGFYTPGNISNATDFGEGVGNVSVTVDDGMNTYLGVTAKSGGYAVPIPGDGNYTVTFSGGGLANYTTNITVSGGNNVKVDYILAAPPSLVIVTPPANVTAVLGKPASFSVNATTTIGNITYQWLLNNSPIKGATKSTYALTKVAATNAGNYTVTVKNSKTSLTSPTATLAILTPVKITTQPKAVTATVGQTTPVVKFTVTATGNPLPTIYQWKIGGANITALNVTGINTSTLTFTNVQTANAGKYQVTVTNSLNGFTNSLSSSAVSLTVKVPPAPKPPKK